MLKFTYALAATALGLTVAGSALAGSLPGSSSGFAGNMDGLSLIESTAQTNSWDPVLMTHIKIAQQKEMVFDVAVQCGLYTRTLVKSKGGNKDTEVATASVALRVAIQALDNAGNPDGPVIYASPNEGELAGWGVTYCSREQTLSATFQGIFQTEEEFTGVKVLEDNNGDGDLGHFVAVCDAGDPDFPDDVCSDPFTVVGTCLFQDADTGGIVLDLACLEDEEIELILNTLNANAFNFVSANLDSGVYEVTVEAEILSSGGDEFTDSEAKALIGLGSMVIDEVRFIHNVDGTTE